MAERGEGKQPEECGCGNFLWENSFASLGVSGSGKSTLINDTLQPILSQHFYRSLQEPLPYDSVEDWTI